ncbi:MAG: DUF1624 domain-containing protein [Burkholderiales bacterium]|nr:DUF1624 domain-containing protein [Burkholderiales bacterium]
MTERERFDRLDALRGVAIVWMAIFHLCFDLNLYALMPAQNFYRDPFWLNQRTGIVSLFLFCAGLAQAVALQAQGGGSSFGARFGVRFWRRWAQVAGCALLVSLGSWFMFPKSWIGFGVLHGIAVMLILARLAAPAGAWLWPLAALAIAVPQFFRHPWFNQPFAHWTGLVTKKPITEDWVPVLPWLGVMLAGLAAGQWLLAHRRALLAGAVPRALAPLALLGRWSLTFYMTHQLVFLGVIVGGRRLGWW